MAPDGILSALEHAHHGRYLVRIRAVNRSGNTVDVVGYVTEIGTDGRIRVTGGDPRHGDVHDFLARHILGVARVHGS